MKKITPFLFCFITFFFSCRKDPKNPTWDIDILAPLIKSNLTINNIILDSLLHENPDNSLDIIYKKDLYSFSAVTIPDTTMDTVYFSPLMIIADSCDPIISLPPEEIDLNVGTVQLTTVTIRSGKMQFSLENKTRKILDVRYQILSASLNGSPFDITVSVPSKTGSNPGVISSTFDLSGYKLNLTGQSGNKVNTIVTKISVKVNCLDFPKDTIFPFSDNIKVKTSFLDIIPQYAKGYFGSTTTVVGPDSTDFSLFKPIIDGTIDFKDIRIGLNIENSVGVDAKVTLNDLSSINTRAGSTIQLSHSIIGSPLNIDRSLDNAGIVTPSTYSVSFTPSNSNIKQFIQNFPDKMSYQIGVELNPLGNVSGGNDFIYYDKLMRMQMNMIIPLSLVANDLTLADTVDFNFSSNTDNINSGKLYLFIDNGFPFTAETQLYLLDANLTIVDSLLNVPNTILAPPLDANFMCVGQKLTKLTIPVDEKKIQLLKNTNKMFIKMKYNTASQPNHVKIYSFYEMNVKIVGDVNYTIGK